MRIERITNGIVLDHIQAGKGIDILNLFPTPFLKTQIDYASYVDSPSHQLKDIIKIENLDVDPMLLTKLALISPNLTISIIRNGQVAEKIKPTVPDMVEGVENCTNPKCITLKESYLKSKIFIKRDDEGNLLKQCSYCEHTFL